ncbi:MAG: hypothetical protein J4F98_14495 [Acidobacteria bacterium]|nr:hypothetical protein [Acidobacteriota bacterium]
MRENEKAIDPGMRFLGEQIRAGFADLGDRIAGGGSTVGGHENLAIPSMETANALERIASALESLVTVLENRE